MEKKCLRRLEAGRINVKGQSPAWGIRRPFKEWGLILQAIRVATGLSQQEFAKLVGITRVSESYYENGIYAPTTDHAKKIAQVVLDLLISKNECIKMVEEVDKEIAKITGEGE